MDDIVIRAENVGKRYVLNHLSQGGYRRFSDSLIHMAKAPVRWLSKKSTANDAPATTEDFWALKDVSFEIKRGEVVGIIGRNGAGKSTLLKLLSRITDPTEGRIALRGRVASLLEVGTGFHPELTGRENIFLNGAILGMRREEIKAKFDEIVAFAEIEKFLDTPVKRYSSGMYVRLAFAVAAHLEPEILIVDEVLAVGDQKFQRKCLGKMNSVASTGRTVLFVSHNIAALQGLCSHGLVLDKGQLSKAGDITTAIGHYMSATSDASGQSDLIQTGHYRHRGTAVRLTSLQVEVDGMTTRTVAAGMPCTFRVAYECLDEAAVGRELAVSIMLYADGEKLVNLWTNYSGGSGERIEKSGVIECVIPRWPFRLDSFRADIYTHIGSDVQDWVENSLQFDSIDGDFYGSGVITNQGQGILFLEHHWRSSLCQ